MISVSVLRLVAQMVKHLPTVQETQVQSLGLEDPLKKGMAIHSSILAWRIPWTKESGGLQFMGSIPGPQGVWQYVGGRVFGGGHLHIGGDDSGLGRVSVGPFVKTVQKSAGCL